MFILEGHNDSTECKTGTSHSLISKLIFSMNVWSGVFQWFSLSPSANWENNRGAMVERQKGKKGMCSRIYISWVPCCPRGISGPPYTGAIHTWDLHETDFDGISLQLKRWNATRIHIHNWTLHGGWEGASVQKRVSSFSFLHHRASGCLGLFLDGQFFNGNLRKECDTAQTSLTPIPNVLWMLISLLIYKKNTRGGGGRVDMMKDKQNQTANKDGKR